MFQLGDIRLYECPLSWITDETWELCRLLYLAQDTGVLYAAGGWADQPRWFLEAYELMRLEMIKWQRKTTSK